MVAEPIQMPDILARTKQIQENADFSYPLDGGGGGPNDPGMELHERVAKVEERFDSVLPMLATKADLKDTENGIIKWVAGTGIAMAAIIVSIITFMFNQLKSPAPSATASTPYVIVVPSVPQQSGQTPSSPASATEKPKT